MQKDFAVKRSSPPVPSFFDQAGSEGPLLLQGEKYYEEYD